MSKHIARFHVDGNTIDSVHETELLAVTAAVDGLETGIWSLLPNGKRLYPPHAIIMVDLFEVKDE